MGTRNLTCVLQNGEFKVAQYCQWDGYPTGQGKIIVDFLKSGFDKEKFVKELNKILWITEEEHKKFWKEAGSKGDGWVSMDVADKFKKAHPELHRDTGGVILQLIQEGKVKVLNNSIDFADDSLFCEWCYILNLDNDTLEVYGGFNKEPIDHEERFYKEKPTDSGYYPVRLLDVFDIRNPEDLDRVFKLEESEEDE